METVRSMLDDSGLPQRFWAEALSTAAYLINRSPTTTLEDMTPFEAWYSKKPNVSHLRVFGCSRYVHIPKDERKKLDPKAKRCTFLGYGTTRKGYRLYDHNKSAVIYSRDVVFDESSRGYDGRRERQQIQVENLPEEDEPVTQALGDHTLDTNQDQAEPEGIAPIPEEEENPTENTEDETASAPVPLRRSTRTTQGQRPDHYDAWVYTAAEQQTPQTVSEALSYPGREEWKSAMEMEMNSIYSNDVWDLVELPANRRAIGSKWVFKEKTRDDGTIERYKARLVAQGFSQQPGLDYEETFCPVIRYESLRSLIAIAAQKDLQLHQLDVTTAFLNGQFEAEIFMKQPEGYVIKGKEHMVCRLKKSIYGLKQSSRCWNATLHFHLLDMGFIQSTSDPCLYMHSGGDPLYIGVYVDDMVLAGATDRKISEVKQSLSKKLDVKDLGKLHHFLGITVIQEKECIWIGQAAFTESILQKFGMDNAKPAKTPANVNGKLSKATPESETVDQCIYQSAVGSLLYLSTRTRPDITFAVNNVARFCSQPTQEHWIAVKRIFRYLRGTTNLGLHYTKHSQSGELVGYSDADWDNDCNDSKSVTGYLFQVGGTAVTWRSQKQSCVALSTAEAEYMALCSAAQEAVWMRELSSDLGNQQSQPTLIHEDNQSAIAMAKNPQFHKRSKHINIKYHYVREQVNNGKIVVNYCPTEEMLADLLTKGIGPTKFNKLRDMYGLCVQPSAK